VNYPSTVESSTHRVFFALWPDLQIRSELAKIAATELRGNGKRVPSNNLHLTLAFVGAVDTKQEDLARAADLVHESAFRLNLERLGFFDNSEVAWSAPGEIDVALSALVNALHGALSERQLAFDSVTFRPQLVR
jgi:2'-5' RNA ligase